MADIVVGLYAQGALTGDRLQESIDRAMNSLATDEDELARLGVTPTDVRGTNFSVKQEGGFIAEGVLIAIVSGAGASLTADAVKAVWGAILKRVKQDRGEDAIGSEQPLDQMDKRE
jgi:hypothetical protein